MISNEELKKLSKLARIEISEEELNDLSKDINSILDYIGQVSQMNADKKTQMNPGTTELRSGYGAGADEKDKVLRNVMREDKNSHEAGEFTNDLLKEVPETKDRYVKVKKIL